MWTAVARRMRPPKMLRSREALPPEERVELLTHRCFVRTRKEDDDHWPYEDTLTLSL